MTTTSTPPFLFGTLTLPADVEKRARSICETLNLTATQLFCKWEAWALQHSKTSDVPSVAEIEQLAESIRDKEKEREKDNAGRISGGTTPRSVSQRSKRRQSMTGSPVYKPPIAPIPLNIDDFFNYVPGGNEEDANDDGTGRMKMDDESKNTTEKKENKEMLSPEDENKGDTKGDERVLKTERTLKRETELVGTDNKKRRANLDLDMDSDELKLPGDEILDTMYAERAGAGRVEATFGAANTAALSTFQTSSSRQSSSMTCKVVQSVPSNVPYMNDDLSSRIENMRARVQSVGRKILQRVAHVRDLDEVPECPAEAFFVASPDVTWAVGRVSVELDEVDGVVGTGRINRESVMLESADGVLVKLLLNRIFDEKRPLFLAPGSVVVVEGVNTNGRHIDVHAIHDNCVDMKPSHSKPKARQPTPSTKTEKEDKLLDTKKGEDRIEAKTEPELQREEKEGSDIEMKEKSESKKEEEFVETEDSIKIDDEANVVEEGRTQKLKIFTASGPFTTAANLKYEPLNDFLDIISRDCPDVAILLGPFVDSRHQLMNPSSLPVPFDMIFESRVMRKITTVAQRVPLTKFIIVPSLEDVHHSYVAPQPAFRTEHPNIQVTHVSNPSILEFNHIHNNVNLSTRVAVTSLPGIADLASDCICWNTDRFHSIASHFIRQQSMYPIVPPSKNVPLDSNLMHHLKLPQFDNAPSADLMICPSRIKAFVRCVDEDVVFVNPGLVCRGNGGGTYAEIDMPMHANTMGLRDKNFNEQRAQVHVIRL